jgi:hypothetical protein
MCASPDMRCPRDPVRDHIMLLVESGGSPLVTPVRLGGGIGRRRWSCRAAGLGTARRSGASGRAQILGWSAGGRRNPAAGRRNGPPAATSALIFTLPPISRTRAPDQHRAPPMAVLRPGPDRRLAAGGRPAHPPPDPAQRRRHRPPPPGPTQSPQWRARLLAALGFACAVAAPLAELAGLDRSSGPDRLALSAPMVSG